MHTLTQNAVPSEGIAVKRQRMGVVSSDDGQCLFLIGQLQRLGNSVVKGDSFMQRHRGTTSMVSLINTPTCIRNTLITDQLLNKEQHTQCHAATGNELLIRRGQEAQSS